MFWEEDEDKNLSYSVPDDIIDLVLLILYFQSNVKYSHSTTHGLYQEKFLSTYLGLKQRQQQAFIKYMLQKVITAGCDLMIMKRMHFSTPLAAQK